MTDYQNACDSASFMFVTNGIDSFDGRIRKAIYKFRQRVQIRPNSIINNYFVVQYDVYTTLNNVLYTQIV